MACIAEAHRPSSDPPGSARAPGRSRQGVTRTSRLAGVLLLLLWVGPVTFAQTDAWHLLRLAGAPERASAESQVIPAGRALLLEVGTSLRLRLRDGKVIEGRFLGRTLLDSALYAPRFAAHARSSAYVPLTLGETLHITLGDGREWTAPFAGYAELTLLLASPDGPEPLRVPFELATEIRRAAGERVEPSALTRAFHADLLPSAEALTIETRWHAGHTGDPSAGAIQVPVQDIEVVTLAIPRAPARSGASAGEVAGIVVLSVLVSVVLVIAIIAHSFNSASRSCGSIPASASLAGVHRTTRPFDRHRGCYVDDALTVVDPTPASTMSGPAVELAQTAARPSPPDRPQQILHDQGR